MTDVKQDWPSSKMSSKEAIFALSGTAGVWADLTCTFQPFLSSDPDNLQVLTKAKCWLWAFLVRCILPLLSTLSLTSDLFGLASRVNHNTDSLPACQRVRVHAGVLETIEELNREAQHTHERLACCEDGGWRWATKTLFILCFAQRKGGSPVEMKWPFWTCCHVTSLFS